MNDRNRTSQGFTLVELMVVVLILGLLATMAIPRLLTALQKSKQTRTVADMRTVAMAVEAYNADSSFYPTLGTTTTAALAGVVDIVVPRHDGWINDLTYSSTSGEHYTVVSFGSNFIEDLPYVYGPIQRFQDDLVIRDTVWMQWPEGVQTE